MLIRELKRAQLEVLPVRAFERIRLLDLLNDLTGALLEGLSHAAVVALRLDSLPQRRQAHLELGRRKRGSRALVSLRQSPVNRIEVLPRPLLNR